MERSLTVLLPVQNAQSTLAATVQEVLEVAAEMSGRFELLIIDDGSIDATSEVAHDLSVHYPQIRLIRQGSPRGREAAIRTGLEHSRGDVILLRDTLDSQPSQDTNQWWRTSDTRQASRPSPVPRSHAESRPARPNFLDRVAASSAVQR